MKPVYIYVTPFFPSPKDWRGAYCYDFVRAVNRTGRFDVRVFVPGCGDNYEIGGVRVYRFPTRQLPSAAFPFFFRSGNCKSFLSAVAAAGIDIASAAVCHCNTAYCGIYGLAVKAVNRGCVTLMHHHCLESFGLNRGVLSECFLHNIVNFPLMRSMHEQFDCHVFISEQSRRSFLAAPDTSWTTYSHYRRQMAGLGFYRPAGIKKSVILHNGVDMSLFNPGSESEKPGGVFTIGCVANFDPLKGLFDLLNALSLISGKLGEWKLKLVGSGPQGKKLRAFAASSAISPHVEFSGEMPHEALPDFYRGLDLFVLPSVFEGFGCVYAEAAACGVPFIACEGQGIEDIVPKSERHLWLARPGDDVDLSEKILLYYRNRPKQTISAPISIDALVPGFLSSVIPPKGAEV